MCTSFCPYVLICCYAVIVSLVSFYFNVSLFISSFVLASHLHFLRLHTTCRGHLLGRLASTVAKELLLGQRIVIVRAEELNVSGSRKFNAVCTQSLDRLSLHLQSFIVIHYRPS